LPFHIVSFCVQAVEAMRIFAFTAPALRFRLQHLSPATIANRWPNLRALPEDCARGPQVCDLLSYLKLPTKAQGVRIDNLCGTFANRTVNATADLTGRLKIFPAEATCLE